MKYTNYRDTSLSSLTTNVYAKCLEEKWCEIVEPELDDTQCSFRPGSSIRDQIFTLEHNFGKSCEHVKNVCTCFADLMKANDRVLETIFVIAAEYGVDVCLFLAV